MGRHMQDGSVRALRMEACEQKKGWMQLTMLVLERFVSE